MGEREDASAPALEIRNLNHAFGARTALSEVSFAARRGAFTALLGVNGAGKSTLVNLVTRLYARRTGDILICGIDASSRPSDALRRLGVVFQSRSLDASLSVLRNLVYVGALYGLSRADALARAEPLLDRIGLLPRLHDRVDTLSGGQQRRLEIVRALIHRPALLLCDEPTAGLDIRSRKEVVELAHRLAAEQDVGVLWATHLTDEVRDEDEVVILHQGRVLTFGRAGAVAAETARRLGLGSSGAPVSLAEAFLALTSAGPEGAA